MTWILLVGFVSVYHGGITSAQYQTQEACEAAKSAIFEEYKKANATPFSDGSGDFMAVCTPSGNTK